MEKTLVFQRIDPEQHAYRWYRITLTNDSRESLFPQSKVVISRGRIGEDGERIERCFDDESNALEYFQRKVNERRARGYVEVETIESPFEPTCSLCTLLRRLSNDPCFVFEFKRSALILNWDQTYLGRSMLVFKKHIPDFFRLAPSELLASMGEIRQSERALRRAFSPRVMNYLFMGNTAGHVHLHLVPRYPSDPHFGSSPFLRTSQAAEPQLPATRYKELAEEIRKCIG